MDGSTGGTRSPSRMRMKLPGTSPPNVQNKYSTPSDILRTTSFTSSFTMTFVACERLMGGGTWGACVRTAISSPLISGSAPLPFGARGVAASAAMPESGVAASKNAPTSAPVQTGKNELSFMPEASARRERTAKHSLPKSAQELAMRARSADFTFGVIVCVLCC